MMQQTYAVQRTFINVCEPVDDTLPLRKRSNSWDGCMSVVSSTESTCCDTADDDSDKSTLDESELGVMSAEAGSECSDQEEAFVVSCPVHVSQTREELEATAARQMDQANELMKKAQELRDAAAQVAQVKLAQQTLVRASASVDTRNTPHENYELDNTTNSDVSKSSHAERTTVMLRNIPNDYTRDMVLSLLDGQGFAGKYNFIYVPVDFQRWTGLGYAFVNMVTSADAMQVKARLDGFRNWVCASSKACNVCWGEPLQGLDAHIDRYRNSPVMNEMVPDRFKPALFQNGYRIEFPVPTKRIRIPRMKQIGKATQRSVLPFHKLGCCNQ